MIRRILFIGTVALAAVTALAAGGSGDPILGAYTGTWSY